MSVTNLPHKHILLVAPLTTRDEARYRSRVAILPTQPAFDALVTRSSSEYRHKVWYGKTRMVWLPDGEKKLKIRLFVSTAYTNVSNTSLVFHTKRYGNIPTGTSNGGVECRWGLKNRSVRPISSFIACCQRRDRQML